MELSIPKGAVLLELFTQKIATHFIEEITKGIKTGEFYCTDAKKVTFEIISIVELFWYRSIFKERFVFEKFGPDLEGFQEGRQRDLQALTAELTVSGNFSMLSTAC